MAREGQSAAFTGFPIGSALGLVPVTHRATVGAITPIALPSENAQQLDERVLRRLESGPFRVLQLDATAYPGNSGSPLYDAGTGEVLGIVNMAFVKGTKEAALSQPSGITFAVPVRHLKKMLTELK
jgi:S1-C subfamily serine protease